MNTELRKNCPMRHENGNCTPCGGFCTAVNDPICKGLHNAYGTGVYAGAIRAQEEAEKNEPLTLEELREMDGEPVWLKIAGGVWGLVDGDDNTVWLDRGGSIEIAKLTGLAYRHKPEPSKEGEL